MIKITTKSQIILMYIFASAVYFMSYTTRINYNTVLVEISTAESISPKSACVTFDSELYYIRIGSDYQWMAGGQV